jgi:molybdate transport system ATP-binding protein
VETVEPARVLEVADGLATVAVGQSQLVALAPGCGAGEGYVCIRAEDIVLGKELTAPSSARNRLAGVVRALVRERPMMRVSLDCGFPLTAVVTYQAYLELGLQEEDHVTALVKAPSVHFVPRE